MSEQADGSPADAPEESQPSSEATPHSDAKPSKSNLVTVEKKASMMSKQQSHVRVVEPKDEADIVAEVTKKPSVVEKRKSDAEVLKTDVGLQKGDTDKRKSLEISGKPKETSAPHLGKEKSATLPGTSITSTEALVRRRSDRPSKAKVVVGSVISIRRTSAYGEYFTGTKTAKYMNTYKLDSDNPFQVEKVEKILKEVLTETLENLTYDPDKCPKLAKWACSAIRARVKQKEFERYKLVIIVTIGEKRYQDMCSVVRFLWDIERDKYALFVHENMYVYASAMCFGIYYE